MQQMTQTLIDQIRSMYQIPVSKADLLHADGSFSKSLDEDLISWSITGAKNKKTKRSLTLTLDNTGGKYSPDPNLADANPIWYNMQIKILAGYKTGVSYNQEEMLPQGVYIVDDINVQSSKQGDKIQIKALDPMSKLQDDKFDDVYTVEDPAAIESDNYALASMGAAATASTSLSAGDPIQRQARIYSLENHAIINGIKQNAENENKEQSSDPSRMLDGWTSSGWLMEYTPKDGETVTQIDADVFVDLGDEENLQQVTINLSSGAELTDYVETSKDLIVWESYAATSFTPNDQVRFIRFNARKIAADADGIWRMGITEIQLLTANNHYPMDAIDGDSSISSWRPSPDDANPTLTLALGASRTLNSLRLFWGSEAFDFNSRIHYYLQYSTDGVNWQRLPDLNGLDENISLFGDVEHVFDNLAMTHIRIMITRMSGSVQLRHIMARMISATQYADKVMRDVLDMSGFDGAAANIPKTRHVIKSMQASIGEEKRDFLARVAGRAGWDDPDFDENGIFTVKKRDINPVDVAWKFTTSADNIINFSPSFSDAIKNVIVAVYSGSDQKAIVGRAIDDNPLSPTYFGTLGRRVEKYENEAIDTQEKADAFAQQKLFENTRLKHSAEIPQTGHPAFEFDDVITVTVGKAKIEQIQYIVTGLDHEFSADPRSYQTIVKASQL